MLRCSIARGYRVRLTLSGPDQGTWVAPRSVSAHIARSRDLLRNVLDPRSAQRTEFSADPIRLGHPRG